MRKAIFVFMAAIAISTTSYAEEYHKGIAAGLRVHHPEEPPRTQSHRRHMHEQ